IIVQPLMLGYVNQSHTFFAYLTGDVGLPTGAYNVNRIANVGTNTYAFMPSLNATWFPTPDWELSGTALLEINSPNHATNYHSGAVASFDWLIGYSVTKQFQVGVQGFYLKQFTDDTINGQSVNGDGFRGQAVGIGPQIRWDWTPGSSVVLKYQHEFAVRNRPQGERIWLEVSVPFK
ncbi:SphA family protein, partial [Burkholderia multivorans]